MDRLHYTGRERSDVWVFHALWRNHFRWTAPTDDELRKYMWQWQNYPRLTVKKVMDLTAYKFQHKGLVYEIGEFCTLVLTRLKARSMVDRTMQCWMTWPTLRWTPK